MSVRAYRIITKELADQASFNLWHDEELLDFFKECDSGSETNYFNMNGDENGGASIEINVATLERALRDYKWEEDDYRIEAIKDDIKWAKDNKIEWVTYECF